LGQQPLLFLPKAVSRCIFLDQPWLVSKIIA
jgi:hypothetical protein